MTVLSRLPPPGSHTDCKLKYTPSLAVKKAYSLILELQPEGQTSGFPPIEATDVLSANVDWGCQFLVEGE